MAGTFTSMAITAAGAAAIRAIWYGFQEWKQKRAQLDVAQRNSGIITDRVVGVTDFTMRAVFWLVVLQIVVFLVWWIWATNQ